MWSRLFRFLRADLERSRILASARSPTARVDPSAFSEDEFPVVCPKCDYNLRGIECGVCPECGDQFDRGHLIVVQYLSEARIRYLRKQYRLGVILCVGSLAAVFVWIALVIIDLHFFDPSLLNITLIWAGAIAGGVTYSGGVVLLASLFLRNRTKLRKVLQFYIENEAVIEANRRE